MTNTPLAFYFGAMTLDQAVQQVQFAYPQVYHACHTRHQRKRSTDYRLSQRDAAILAHCSPNAACVPAQLARHLDIARSTLSEALKKLEQLGYVCRVSDADGDGRSVGVLLTAKGLRAVRETSVLESRRLEAVLRCATASDRAAIAAGLSALADACRRHREVASSKGGTS